MPPSALNRLASMRIEYPMLFELRNTYAERVTHCGVMEFIADEGVIHIPNWMMENLRLQEGDIVILRNICLPKGAFVKMQPHTKDFLDLYNPRAMLETSLRSYSCLTTGDTIVLDYNNKKYYIDVLETKPYSAISIIETDCEVDFAQPLDYTEPEKQLPEKESPEVEDELTTKKVQLIPFSGCGRRLDGKPSTQSAEQMSSSMLKQQQTENETKNSNSKSSNTRSRRTSGKLVFGSNANMPKIQTPPKASAESTSEESSQKAEEPKFQAFTGKKYSLMS
ncbi:uncharacterized protein LOC133311435 [Gastrolobium bilobum]|uniref:uncharacterized protein LOC133311435 n=1 Tax=Gastrolobium bilobum TaxID=150636 RepID=UPI002AB10C7A|nr:uncharacterized protein LOC133311435 [Gastrolobium bilobum]